MDDWMEAEIEKIEMRARKKEIMQDTNFISD
jgi:hypothetical protein